MNIQAIRGATTCIKNSSDAIEEAVQKLVFELVQRNKLHPDQVISMTFSVTNDLNACFPASIASASDLHCPAFKAATSSFLRLPCASFSLGSGFPKHGN